VAKGIGLTQERLLSSELRVFAMPFKLNQDRRHHIPRQQRKITNWPAYEASLRQRGLPHRVVSR
jgi:hypothetical protein